MKFTDKERLDIMKGELVNGYDWSYQSKEWLVELAAQLENPELCSLQKRSKALDDIANAWMHIENEGTSEDAGNFYTLVQDILSNGKY